MNKIIILVGVSGSGKSTWAFNYVKENPNTIIISRDNIRMLLYGYNESNIKNYYNLSDLKEKEVEVTNFSDSLIWKAIREGKDIIVDNTHLEMKYINAYRKFACLLELKFIDVTLVDAIYQDLKRSKSVGETLIKKQFDRYNALKSKTNLQNEIDEFNLFVKDVFVTCRKSEYDYNKPDAFLFDLDGTLALTGDRNIFDFSKVDVDILNKPIGFINNAITYHDANHYTNTIICSGRDESCAEITKKWLTKYGINYSSLYMRSKGDMRPDWMVKAEMWKKIQLTYNIQCMVDDRLQVVDFARRLGYTVCQCAYGEF